VNLGTFRQNSVLQSSTWSNKSETTQGVGLGLANRLSPRRQQPLQRTTPCGHRELLRVIPRGYIQLADRGFSSCTAAYEHLVQCFFPAFAKDIIDAKKQSADRYVVETLPQTAGE
jgi:hypothetical protein